MTEQASYTIGSKAITIKDISLMLEAIPSHYVPTIKIANTKDESVYYEMGIFDKNTKKVYDVNIEIPESMSSTVRMAVNPTGGDELVPVWSTLDAASHKFKLDLNMLINHWFEKILTQSKIECNIDNDDNDSIRVYYPESHTVLQYPWKKGTANDYFNSFDPENQVHIIRIGSGVFKRDKKYIACFLQLGGYPGKTQSAQIKAAQRASESRKRNRKAAEEETQVDEPDRSLC